MKKTKYFFISLAFFLIFIISADVMFVNNIPVWSSGTNIAIPVRAGNTASYSKNNNGYLFIVSGRDQNDQIIKTTQRYNVNSNIWDTLNPHPTGLLGGATTILKDSLYIVGGVVNPPGSGQTTVYKFSINQNQWSTVQDIPTLDVDSKAVSYQDSLIYVAGGVTGLSAQGTVFLYNAVSNSWRQATSFTFSGRRNFGGFAVAGDTLIYMCGTNAFGSTITFDSVYVGVISQSDRSVINWTRGANFPGQTRSFFDACTWGNRGIIMTGGSTDNTFSSPSNECYTYSPGRNVWTKLPDKPTAWLTGQSGSVRLSNNVWKLICAGGYNNGYLSANEILTDTLSVVGIIDNVNGIPLKIKLNQNYPNPFNPNTIISYELSKPEFVNLKIFDINGREVCKLFSGKQNPGNYSINFSGNNLPSGIYFSKIEAGTFTDMKKMTLLK